MMGIPIPNTSIGSIIPELMMGSGISGLGLGLGSVFTSRLNQSRFTTDLPNISIQLLDGVVTTAVQTWNYISSYFNLSSSSDSCITVMAGAGNTVRARGGAAIDDTDLVILQDEFLQCINAYETLPLSITLTEESVGARRTVFAKCMQYLDGVQVFARSVKINNNIAFGLVKLYVACVYSNRLNYCTVYRAKWSNYRYPEMIAGITLILASCVYSCWYMYSSTQCFLPDCASHVGSGPRNRVSTSTSGIAVIFGLQCIFVFLHALSCMSNSFIIHVSNPDLCW